MIEDTVNLLVFLAPHFTEQAKFAASTIRLAL